jgi:release factor glutamine methyltransferase
VKVRHLLALCREAYGRLPFAGDGEAEVVAAAAAGIPRGRLVPEGDREAPEGAADVALGWIRRRAGREPLQYVLGAWDFFGREFLLCPHVLVPRPETEGLVEAFLGEARARGWSRFVDVGTGSGAIAVTLALELPGSRVVATDLSRDALRTARRNAERLGAGERVRFACADLLSPFRQGALFDAVVSNPPYVDPADRESLEPELSFEPPGALFAGEEGLAALRALAASAGAVLREGGELWCEIGASQGEAVSRLPCAPMRFVEVRKDLSGRDRVARWRLGGPPRGGR